MLLKDRFKTVLPKVAETAPTNTQHNAHSDPKPQLCIVLPDAKVQAWIKVLGATLLQQQMAKAKALITILQAPPGLHSQH